MKVLNRVTIIIVSAFIILYLLSFVVIDGNYVDIRLEGEAMNQTGYLFSFPPNEVRKVIDKCYNINIRNGYGRPEPRLRALGWQKNRMYFFRHPPVYSYVYRDKEGNKLDYNAGFYLQLDSLSENSTFVQIVSEKPELSVGKYLAFNPRSGKIGIPRSIKVAPSTIEEYEVLKYIGKRLGQTGMPPIRYPKALNREDVCKNVFNIYGDFICPFTPGDMVFGE